MASLSELLEAFSVEASKSPILTGLLKNGKATAPCNIC